MNASTGPDVLDTISRNQLRSARRLLRRKGRKESGLFLAEGAQAVHEALLSGKVESLIVSEPDRHSELLAEAVEVPVLLLAPADAGSLSDTVTPPGIWAITRDISLDLADLDADARLVVICAQIRDPGNAGTVIRCADAFGADAVIFTAGSVELTNPKTVRASVGSIFHLPIVTGVDYPQAIGWARSRGLLTCAADTSGESLDGLVSSGRLNQPIAWVLGNEAWGLPGEILAEVDQIVAIPMWGKAESLNLATAAAVCLYSTASAQRNAGYDQLG